MAVQPGTYNLGPDNTLTISRNDTDEQIILDGVRSKFDSQYDDEIVKGSPIDIGGRVIATRIPGGLSGSIEVERATNDFDALIMFLDANYYAQGPHVRFTITETVVEADRSTSDSAQFTNVVFHGYHRGSYERTGIVKVSVQFFATELLPV
jgi:hypothetical protein